MIQEDEEDQGLGEGLDMLSLGDDQSIASENAANGFERKPLYKCEKENCGGTVFFKDEGGAVLVCRACKTVLQNHNEGQKQEYEFVQANAAKHHRVRITKHIKEDQKGADRKNSKDDHNEELQFGSNKKKRNFN